MNDDLEELAIELCVVVGVYVGGVLAVVGGLVGIAYFVRSLSCT